MRILLVIDVPEQDHKGEVVLKSTGSMGAEILYAASADVWTFSFRLHKALSVLEGLLGLDEWPDSPELFG